jgi:hypothetical protein
MVQMLNFMWFTQRESLVISHWSLGFVFVGSRLLLCSAQCQENFFNNGSFTACQPCPSGYTSPQGASNCTQLPPVDCFGAWTSMSACDISCGGGQQSATYIISQPALYGGAACPHSNGEVLVQDCNTQLCPIHCIGEGCAALLFALSN